MAQAPPPLYVPEPYGTNTVKRLGETIGARRALSEPEQELYETFIRDARQRVLAGRTVVAAMLRGYGGFLPRIDESVEISGRWKTLATLTDKLERTPDEKLPSIHDVAGLRVVAEVTTLEQRILAEILARQFNEVVRTTRPARVINRLESPSHGYRAIHVIVWPEGRPIEIQIRTQLQHAWAQIMEALGDRWGRELRYGLAVRHEDPEVATARQGRVDQMLQLSEMIAAVEQNTAAQGMLHLNVEIESIPEIDHDEVRRFREHAARSVEEHAAAIAAIRELVNGLRDDPTAP